MPTVPVVGVGFPEQKAPDLRATSELLALFRWILSSERHAIGNAIA